MAEGRSRTLWSHTSTLIAAMANIHRDPDRTRAFRPDQFNPHEARGRERAHVSVERLTDEIMMVAESKLGRL
jgi:hypothetical protein